MTIEALAPGERTLPAMLRRGAERHGDRALVGFGARSWSHRDLPRLAAARAATLRAAGVGRGDRVAVMLSNRIELIEVVVACGWIGAAAVPINTAAMGPQIGYVLGDCAARLLVIEGGFVERLATADLGDRALETTWVVGEATGIDTTTRAAIVGSRTRHEAIRGATPPGPPMPSRIACVPLPPLPDGIDDAAHAADPAIVPADTLAVLYTSGTTGPAKGVLCSHAQLHWWGVHSADVLGVGADDVLCTTLPLFHINALNTFAQASLAGCRVAYEPRFSLDSSVLQFHPTLDRTGPRLEIWNDFLPAAQHPDHDEDEQDRGDEAAADVDGRSGEQGGSECGHGSLLEVDRRGSIRRRQRSVLILRTGTLKIASATTKT